MAKFYTRESRYNSGSISGDIVNLNWYKYIYGTTTFRTPLPNCTTYAYGRTMEIYYQNGYDISTRQHYNNPFWWNSGGSVYGNAETWYNDSRCTWEKGSTPRLGAIACFSGAIYGKGGHVAVIEKINADGTVNWSESNYGGTTFEYVTNQRLVVGQVNSHVGERFQGFIYNPLIFDSGSDLLFYRRGDYIKIIKYGRASSFGKLPIAKGLGWKKYVLRVYKDRPYPLQIGDIRTGITTGFYTYDGVQLLQKGKEK